jgi:hypothetical protein
MSLAKENGKGLADGGVPGPDVMSPFGSSSRLVKHIMPTEDVSMHFPKDPKVAIRELDNMPQRDLQVTIPRTPPCKNMFQSNHDEVYVALGCATSCAPRLCVWNAPGKHFLHSFTMNFVRRLCETS